MKLLKPYVDGYRYEFSKQFVETAIRYETEIFSRWNSTVVPILGVKFIDAYNDTSSTVFNIHFVVNETSNVTAMIDQEIYRISSNLSDFETNFAPQAHGK